jgi:hypothetical protein
MEIPVEDLAVGVANALADGLSVATSAARSIRGAGVSTISDLSKGKKRDLPPDTIPVEPLTNGIVSVFGDGVNVVVEECKSTGTYLASKVPAIATAGLVLFCEFTGEIMDKLLGGKRIR